MRNIYDINVVVNDGNELEVIENVITPGQYDGLNDDTSKGTLKVSVKINNEGDLEVSDITPYEDWQVIHDFDKEEDVDHIVLERALLNDGSNEPLVVIQYSKIAHSYADLRHPGIYDVPGNGLYHYQKLVLPTKDHATGHSLERLYFDPEDNKVHYKDLDSAKPEEAEPYDIWEDFDTIYDLVINNNFSNCFYYGSDTFSMYNLVKCYVAKEYERLQDYLKNNCTKCSRNDSLDTETDLLLSAMTVIERLCEEGDFFDAQRILNGLNTCGAICKDVNKLKGCGCGRN